MIIDFSDKSLYNEKFIPIIDDDKRYIFLMWSWWSWKSVSASQKEIIKSFQIKDKTMCVRKVKDTLKDSMFAELKKRISERKLSEYFAITSSPMSITNKLTWCQFIFRGVDDPEKLKSVEWVARVWIEEATELSKQDFDQIDLRLRWKKHMQITCTFNPTDAEHRLNVDFWVHGNTADVTCLHSTYKDNRFVWDQYAKVMERLKETNPNYYNIYALGQWGVLDWLVFENREIIKDVPEWAKFLWYGQDFWFTNDPSAMVWLYSWNDCIIYDEIFYRTGLTNQDIVEIYKEVWIEYHDEIRADSSEPKSIEEINRAWYNIKSVVKWADSINFGINVMKQNKILITTRSWNLQKEIKKYTWAKDKNGKSVNKPIDLNNHAIDGSRYWAMSLIKRQDLDIYIW